MKYFQMKLFFFLALAIVFLNCNQPSASPKKLSRDKGNIFTVALLPYKDFDTVLLNDVLNEVTAFYKCNAIILPVNNLPGNAFYAPRQRYKADSLLLFQKQLAKDGIKSVIGFTSKDISTSNGKIPDWGVFGLGMCPGKVCVISVYRLQRASTNSAQLKERLIKVVLHELGHNLGLPHCNYNPSCLMTDAGGTIKQVDRENKWLCESCKSKLIN